MEQVAKPNRAGGPLTLALDIGGTHLKAGVLAPDGTVTAGPVHVDTPHPAPPDVVLPALQELTKPLGRVQRVSVGFPGAIRGGRVLTAPNLDNVAWRNFPLTERLSQLLGLPVRLENDGTVQGLGVIAGHGVECVVTLGTGFGFALFDTGRPAPHLELSHHPVHKGKNYDQYLGDAAFHEVGRKRWNRRVHKAIGYIGILTNFDQLYIGGGNSRHVLGELPPNVHLVSNEAGITGGIRLWDPKLDPMFPPIPARRPSA
jgi:polyphosphate glucokinase